MPIALNPHDNSAWQNPCHLSGMDGGVCEVNFFLCQECFWMSIVVGAVDRFVHFVKPLSALLFLVEHMLHEKGIKLVWPQFKKGVVRLGQQFDPRPDCRIFLFSN